eukprot:73284-Chlamydomonas_euryale.AAC.1
MDGRSNNVSMRWWTDGRTGGRTECHTCALASSAATCAKLRRRHSFVPAPPTVRSGTAAYSGRAGACTTAALPSPLPLPPGSCCLLGIHSAALASALECVRGEVLALSS